MDIVHQTGQIGEKYNLQHNQGGRPTTSHLLLLGVVSKANYVVRELGNAIYSSYDEHVYLTLVVDPDNVGQFILYATYRPATPNMRANHVNYVIASNGLSLGIQNEVGTQVVNGSGNQRWHVLQF